STAPRSVSAARYSSGSTAPVRSARRRTCEADSSPLTYNVRRPERAVWAATSSSRVDLPTPGSPARRITAPGTSPPPSTRSSSATPLDTEVAASTATSPMGTAFAVTAPGATRSAGAPTSATDPHVWHSPHRPTHLAASQPHSPQRNIALVRFAVAMRSPYGSVPTLLRSDSNSGRPALVRGPEPTHNGSAAGDRCDAQRRDRV